MPVFLLTAFSFIQKYKIYFIIGAAIIAMLTIGWFMYQDSQKRLIKTVEQKAIQQVENANQTAIIKQQAQDAKKQTIETNHIYKAIAQSQTDTQAMRNRLAFFSLNKVANETRTPTFPQLEEVELPKQSNLATLAITNTLDVELEVNKIANDQKRCLEIVGGSKPTKEELNAKIKNSVCPDLFVK